MTLTQVIVDMMQLVYSDDERRAVIGPNAPDGDETFVGWKWDERVWTSEKFENTDVTVPVLGDPDTRGLADSLWQSGVGTLTSDLEPYQKIKVFKDNIERWTLRVRRGNYFKFKYKRHLFSDRSVIEQIDPNDNVGPRNVRTLGSTPKYGSPIWAIMWRRNDSGIPEMFRFVQKKMTFSGVYDSTGMKLTEDSSGNILWSNVDLTKNEFVVNWNTDPPVLTFNQDYTFLVGKTSVTSDEEMELCEFIGESDGTTAQVLYTEFFPILDNAELTLYSGAFGSTLVKDTDYVIDLDRGEISFLNTPVGGTKMYLKYRPTLEIEYESENSPNYLTAHNISLDPMRSVNERGLVYISEHNIDVAYITLTVDESEINVGIYGPMFVGADYTFLIATAYNNFDETVPGAQITFYLDNTNYGKINGSSDEVTITTDSNGQAKVTYTTPRSTSLMGQYVTHPATDNINELRLLDSTGINSTFLDDIYTYAVYDNDTFQPWTATPDITGPGYGGRKIVLYKWDATAKHPTRGTSGAYNPIQPTLLQEVGANTYLKYSDNLPFTDSTLVAYWVVGPRQIPVHAKTYSALHQVYITENSSVKIQLELPTHFKGVYVAGGFDTPYGWRLPDDNSTIASGLDGATFFGINPLASGAQQILWNGIPTGDEQVNPFRNGVLSIKFKVSV
jgi:hypothetical protein